MKKYYQILGLEEGASKEEIEKKYKKLCEELDPTKNDNQDFFKEEYKKVQEAYKFISTGVSPEILKEKELAEKKAKSNKTKLIIGALILIFIICVIYSLIPERFSIDDVYEDGEITYSKLDSKPISGLIFCKYGELGEYKNGIKEGIHKEYFETGEVKNKFRYKKGKLDGLQEYWDYKLSNYSLITFENGIRSYRLEKNVKLYVDFSTSVHLTFVYLDTVFGEVYYDSINYYVENEKIEIFDGKCEVFCKNDKGRLYHKPFSIDLENGKVYLLNPAKRSYAIDRVEYMGGHSRTCVNRKNGKNRPVLWEMTSDYTKKNVIDITQVDFVFEQPPFSITTYSRY